MHRTLNSRQRRPDDLSVDVFPLFTAADALVQSLHTGLDVAGKDTIQVDLLAAATNNLVAQLYAHTNVNLSLECVL